MPNCGTHYEQAFEAALIERQIPYVAVDQAQKALFAGEQLKSFDFIVYPTQGRKILADVKGRKLSWRSWARNRFDQTWATADDVESLRSWEQAFGRDYLAVFVFAYWIFDAPSPSPDNSRPQGPDECRRQLADTPSDRSDLMALDHCGQRDYVFWAVELSAYQRHMRLRSQSWGTVHVPLRWFAELAVPFNQFVRAPRKRPPNGQA